MTRLLGLAAAALFALVPPAAAQGPLGAPNDLFAFSQGGGQEPNRVPTQQDPDKPAPVPRAQCGPGAKPEPSIQGRVPEGAATDGLWCNIEKVAHQGTSGGFRVWRYTDTKGHTCAFYDTALLFPTNALNLNGNGLGVAVLDMSNPANPQQTATLTEPPMLSPHESLNLNAKRGLLAAVSGNPSAYPGWVSVYDVSQDCRAPTLDFSGPIARLGHESGFSMDGKTFYATSVNSNAITAIDLTDPKAPHVVWLGALDSHGMSLSDDGNRAYIADTHGQLLILDTSEIQARKADPQAREISRLTWERASIPQNALLFTEDGHPYILEFDEYTAGTTGNGSGNDVGAGRIIDIADERAPKVVADLRLQVNEPADHEKYGDDPGADGQINGGVQGYAAHYCNIPTRVNPKLVACSFIASGLRVFDISDLRHPKEVAYYVAPTGPKFENGTQPSNFAMSMPAFDPDRHEVWWTDGVSGFYVLRLVNGAWPAAKSAPKAICASKRVFTIHLKNPTGDHLRSARVTVDGKRVKVHRGRKFTVRIDLRGKGKKVVVVRVRAVTKSGKVVHETRRYHTCRPGS